MTKWLLLGNDTTLDKVPVLTITKENPALSSWLVRILVVMNGCETQELT